MNIKITKKSYEEVLEITQNASKKTQRPKKPNMFFRILLKLVSIPGLIKAGFSYKKTGMERLDKNEPCLYLMNHSSFVDLEIVGSALFPRPFNIVATTDSFVGKNWLMRQIGCIPTKKFVLDLGLIRDMSYALGKLKSSVVMFPEAGYSFDGTATTLPDTLGKLVKMMKVPLVMIRTYGAFSYDPLYNGLQTRKVKVSADIRYLLSKEEVAAATPEEINALIAKEFSFDSFRWQQENKIKIDEPFRADMLNRTLYKCPHCHSESGMLGKGTRIGCTECGKGYELDEYGYLVATGKDGKFEHVPDWYAWERQCVREEIENGSYHFEAPVRIFMAIDTKKIYDVGTGHLTHSTDGFKLTGDDGKLEYAQNVQASYSICSDFNWYEIGDVICIGNQKALYYCFPEVKGDVVAKVRLAAEEMYKIYAEQQKKNA